MQQTPEATSFLVTHVFDLPDRGLVTSGKVLSGKLRPGMTLQDSDRLRVRVLALEFLSPRDIRTGEVTITLERTSPSPVQPNAVLTSMAPSQ
jgi:translation elongation factor EF-G